MKITKEKKFNVPLFRPYISDKAIEKAVEVLKSKHPGQGALIDEFEEVFNKKFKSKYSVAVNSCTSALHLAYILAGVGKGDEVVGPLLTCSATWHPVLWQGAKPVFCDIQDDFTIDPDDIERKITKKTKAIVVMHYGGTMCDMDRITQIARKHKLPVIEDCAQALGAYYHGKKVKGYAGTIGDYAAFSFQAIKYLTTVDGGMLTCKKKQDYEKAKRIRWFGIDRDLKIKKGWEQFKSWERREITYDVWEVGYKYHMNNFNAAIGLEHLKEWNRIDSHYKKLDKLYREDLNNVVKFPEKKKGDTTWLETVLVDRRDDFAKKLKLAGVETNAVHIRSDVYTLFKKYAKGRFPNMDKYELQYLCLPIHMGITEEDVEYACNLVKYGW
jgi:perosamine synthetase